MDIKDYVNTATPRTTTKDGVPVFCSHDQIISLSALVPNPKNPNEHLDDQVKLLADVIKAQGWRQPITVSKRSGFIVKGHGRLMAAYKAGFTEAPVDFQEYATEAQEWADLNADNRLAELAETNTEKLAELFRDIDLDEIPVELTGYNADEFADIIAALDESLSEPEEVEEEPPKEPGETVTQPGDIWRIGENKTTIRASKTPARQRLTVKRELAFIDETIKRYILERGMQDVKLIRNGKEQPPEVLEALL